MGLFFVANQQRAKVLPRGTPSVELLHRMGCKACPLANCQNRNPNMAPTGGKRPLVYVLGEAPGKEEDKEARQFIGASGRFLRDVIPDEWFEDADERRWKTPEIRWNNVVRTRPPSNRTPTWTEIEACRPSVEKDIAEHKPAIVIAVGNTPFQWLTGLGEITAWRGKRLPAMVGGHPVWVYPVLHPAYLIRGDKGSEIDTNKRDFRRIFRDARRARDGVLAKPVVVPPEDTFKGIKIYTGHGENDYRDVLRAIKRARRKKYSGYDIETGSREKLKNKQLRPYGKGAKILSFAISTGLDRTFAVAYHHRQAGWDKAQLKGITKAHKRYLNDPNVHKVCFNSSYELEWNGYFMGRSILRRGKWEDAMMQAFVMDERRSPLSLDNQCRLHLGLALKSQSDLDRSRLDDMDVEAVLRYNGADSKWTLHIFNIMNRQLKREGLLRVYRKKNERAPTLVAAQLMGMRLDFKRNAKLAKRYTRNIKRAEAKLSKLKAVKKFMRVRRKEFNPGSAPDVAYIFGEVMNKKRMLLTDDNKISTDEKILSKIGGPVAEGVLEFREWTKAYGTYVEELAEGGQSIHADGLVHTNFNTMITRTGRLSSNAPNLQNIPVRTEQGRELRNQFVARTREHTLLRIDYGQIQARMIACASKDKVLVRAFWEDYDIHMDWATRLAHLEPRLVGGKAGIKDPKAMKTLRGAVKNNWVFPAFFGASLESVAGYLKIEPRRLRPLYDAFWDEFQGVAEWQDSLMNFYNKHGYVESITGTRRHGPMYRNKIINSPIQAMESDVVGEAMDRLSVEAYERDDYWLQPMLNIHDDLTFDVPVAQLDRYLELAVRSMLKVEYDWLNVPITVEASMGYRWGDKKDIGTFATHTWKKNDARKLAHQMAA